MSVGIFASQYMNRMQMVSQDYLFERLGWAGSTGKVNKCLPYSNEKAVFDLQRVGCWLYNACPIVRSATEKFVSFVIGSGHGYNVAFREGLPPGGVTVDDTTLQQIRWSIQWTMENCYPGGWLALQEETVRRWLREGEVFRRVFNTADGSRVRFVEPYTIRQAPGDDIPGIMGVISEPGDAASVIGFWHNPKVETSSRREDFVELSSASVQYLKYGVDANDPRGVGPFPMVLCSSDRIRTISVAMNELALTQSSYAVVRQYDNVVTADEMRRIASGFRAADEENGNQREFGKEVDAKGFKFEFPSMGIDPKNFIEIISQEIRFIAGVLDMPEFVLMSATGAGSRAGNVSAEGPFARRIARDQNKIGQMDVELMWSSARSMLGWSEEMYRNIRRAVRITPQFPVAYTRDILKDTQAVVLQVENKLLSRQSGSEKLGNDWPTTLGEIREESADDALVPDAGQTPDPTAGSTRG